MPKYIPFPDLPMPNKSGGIVSKKSASYVKHPPPKENKLIPIENRKPRVINPPKQILGDESVIINKPEPKLKSKIKKSNNKYDIKNTLSIPEMIIGGDVVDDPPKTKDMGDYVIQDIDLEDY